MFNQINGNNQYKVPYIYLKGETKIGINDRKYKKKFKAGTIPSRLNHHKFFITLCAMIAENFIWKIHLKISESNICFYI